MCCDQPFHFALQEPCHVSPKGNRPLEVTGRCQPQLGFQALDVQLVQMDQDGVIGRSAKPRPGGLGARRSGDPGPSLGSSDQRPGKA